jgi:alpha-L-rhamnosidase
LKITNVRINGIENPVGFAYDYLLCSWNVEEAKGKKQTNAIIEVSDSEDFTDILYKKEAADLKQNGEKLEVELKPRTTYYYRITVFTDGGECATSETALFETGKMEEPWIGKWISPAKEDTFHPVLEKTFAIEKAVKRARLYLTGVGMFETYLDGKKLGEEYLAPYINDYESGIQVLTFPIEKSLEEEKEYTLSILLGKGWYMGTFGLGMKDKNFGDRMAAIGELHLEYEDGTVEVVATNDSWEYYGSDIEDSGIYLGEILNHQLWDGKENAKKQVEVLENLEEQDGTRNLSVEKLQDRLSLPVIEKETVQVKKIIYTPAEEIVLDMGQNFAGFVEFKATSRKERRLFLILAKSYSREISIIKITVMQNHSLSIFLMEEKRLSVHTLRSLDSAMSV